MTKYIFFSGKGGVGKTTMASATAIHYATAGKKTLIVTTDPASNLADVFEQEIGHKITPIKGVSNLYAMEIDPDEAVREYKERIIGPFRDVMPEDVIASLEENLSGPCTTEMASFDRFIDFMEGDDFDVIVFDTAPTGHTIRLLGLPVDWSRHIEESAKGSGQTCLGPVQSIQGSKEKYDRAIGLLRDKTRTEFVFVMRPEELSLYETMRASSELETIGIKPSEVIINGVLPEEVCEIDFFKNKLDAQRKVIKETESKIPLPKRHMFLRDGELKGTKSLIDVAGELFNGKRPSYKGEITPRDIDSFPDREDFLDKIALNRKSGAMSLFFTGKGGVGKTTVSCMVALKLSEMDFKVLLVTTDPAAHIGEVLGVSVGSEPAMVSENLYAVMVDQRAAFAEYKERVISEARSSCSDEMLSAMEEELNSPCTEEMAAFDRFIRFMESSEYDFIVFDTAPTGHTLRLLDLPFDYAKQVEMMVSTRESEEVKTKGQSRFQKIIDMLRDKERTVFFLVLYPESTPVLESYRAMLDLKEAGIEAQFVVSNMVLSAEVCTNSFFKNRRLMQLQYMDEIRGRFGLPVIQIPLIDGEIKGLHALKTALASMTRTG